MVKRGHKLEAGMKKKWFIMVWEHAKHGQTWSEIKERN